MLWLEREREREKGKVLPCQYAECIDQRSPNKPYDIYRPWVAAIDGFAWCFPTLSVFTVAGSVCMRICLRVPRRPVSRVCRVDLYTKGRPSNHSSVCIPTILRCQYPFLPTRSTPQEFGSWESAVRLEAVSFHLQWRQSVLLHWVVD